MQKKELLKIIVSDNLYILKDDSENKFQYQLSRLKAFIQLLFIK